MNAAIGREERVNGEKSVKLCAKNEKKKRLKKKFAKKKKIKTNESIECVKRKNVEWVTEKWKKPKSRK